MLVIIESRLVHHRLTINIKTGPHFICFGQTPNERHRQNIHYITLELYNVISAMVKCYTLNVITIKFQKCSFSLHGHCTNARGVKKWDKKVRRDVISDLTADEERGDERLQQETLANSGQPDAQHPETLMRWNIDIISLQCLLVNAVHDTRTLALDCVDICMPIHSGVFSQWWQIFTVKQQHAQLWYQN